MNNVRCFTSISNCYLPKARVLAKSIKAIHPDWSFDLLLSDNVLEGFNLDDEPFDTVLEIDQLGIDNLYQWVFKHRVVELCTAVKSFGARQILDSHSPEILIYLDPDIAVFNTLQPLLDYLEQSPIILTPHQVCPEEELDAIIDNEICSMKHGIFNLGFFAVRNEGQGRQFVEWWTNRLKHFCYDDIPNGLFTDQKWCDHVPVFFDKTFILREPNYNVATWNLAHRKVTIDNEGTITVNGKPLRFYHFTGYDSGAGATMLSKYSEGQDVVNELWNWYSLQLEGNGHFELKSSPWHYNFFDNGHKIENEMRFLYRDRKDLQNYFPNPFDTSREDGGFLAWWNKWIEE